MDLLKDKVNKLFAKFLFSAMGGAVVISIYSFVDAIAVGQAEGPIGAAAMAVINPLFGTLVFIGVLCGIGGSVLMSKLKGEGEERKGNACFTTSLIVIVVLTVVFWIAFGIFARDVFTLFGANAELMPKVMEYAQWIIWFFPVFLLPSFLGAFLRNDRAPGLALTAVIVGGVLNIFGDWLLVFPLGLGMKGAAIATVSGTTVQVIIMCSHFFSKKCGLKLVRPDRFRALIGRVLVNGFGSGVLDLGSVVIACVMNNQVMKYGGESELAVFGVVMTLSLLFQALFCGVGQAAQPLVSMNFGAGNSARIKKVFRLSLITVFSLGAVFTLLGELIPTTLVRLFMAATPEVLAVAPGMIRVYFSLFLFLGVNVFSVYYLQSVMRTRRSMMIAVLRGFVISVLAAYLLPLAAGYQGALWAMPLTEIIVSVCVTAFLLTAKRDTCRTDTPRRSEAVIPIEESCSGDSDPATDA